MLAISRRAWYTVQTGLYVYLLFVTKKEAEGRKFRLRVFAGMFDFLATIGSLMLIFACVALLASLATWIRNDAKTTFASIEYSITSAIIMPEDGQAPQATQPPQQ